MNNKGLSVGGIVLVAIAIIIGVLFIEELANQTAPLTNTKTVTNASVTFPANGGTLLLNGQSASGLIITNSTSGGTVPSTNYTLTNLVLSTGGYRAVLTAKNSPYNSRNVNVSYISEPIGYNRDGSSRTVLGLVILFFALAVFALAIPDSREYLFSLMGK